MTASPGFCPVCGMSRAENRAHLCTLEVITYCKPILATLAV